MPNRDSLYSLTVTEDSDLRQVFHQAGLTSDLARQLIVASSGIAEELVAELKRRMRIWSWRTENLERLEHEMLVGQMTSGRVGWVSFTDILMYPLVARHYDAGISKNTLVSPVQRTPMFHKTASVHSGDVPIIRSRAGTFWVLVTDRATQDTNLPAHRMIGVTIQQADPATLSDIYLTLPGRLEVPVRPASGLLWETVGQRPPS